MQRPVATASAGPAWHGAGRDGLAAEVAEAVALPLSDAAASITGENLVVDGGVRRHMRYPE